MLKLISSGLGTAVLVVAGVVGAAASAQAPSLVDKADRHGDVKITGDTQGVDPAVVSSVDLRHVTVTRQPHGVRVVIRMKQVLPTRGRWFQEIGFSVIPPSWVAAPTWFFAAFTTPQHLGSAAAFFVEMDDQEEQETEENPEETEVFCHLDASKGAKVVRLSIPDRCLPRESGQMVVETVLHDKRSIELVAGDELTVGGLVDLQPGR